MWRYKIKRYKELVLSVLTLSFLLASTLMLLNIDGIVNETLYDFNLDFSFEWAVPYQTALKTSLTMLGLSIFAVGLIGYSSAKQAKHRGVVFLCKSCGEAWLKADRNAGSKDRLPRFKFLSSCPTCSKKYIAVVESVELAV